MIRIPKTERAKRNTMIDSRVKSLRGSKEFFDRIDRVAEEEGTSRNELIIRVMNYYINKRGKKR